MNLPEFYQPGDVIEFTDSFDFFVSGVDVVVEKGTLARVLDVVIDSARNGISDAVGASLIISIAYDPDKHTKWSEEKLNASVVTLKLNYMAHYHLFKKKPAAQVLYNKG